MQTTDSSADLSADLDRQTLRQRIRQRRRVLSAEQQASFSQQAAQRVIAHPRIQQARHVAAYLSFDGELDTAPLIVALWRLGKQVYLPVLHPFSAGQLLFLRYERDTELTLNRLNILQPRLDVRQVLPTDQLDILFTPLVAFDDRGQRLGMGGGFYDRTLEHWQERGPYPMGLAHDCQQVERVPAAHWDVPLPEILTPSREWRWPA